MTEPVVIASIVEGHGEVQALPLLLRRIAHALGVWDIHLPPPIRRHRGRLVAPGGIESAVDQAAYHVAGRGGVLVLLDADDDCPAELGPRLLERARRVREDKELSVVLANREFEAWFMAAAPSLAGKRGLADSLVAPDEPESRRGAKEWLTAHKTDGTPYKETVDQPGLTADFDMPQARRNAPSFDKFWRDVERLMLRR
ncbi:DUF4276 family protein [Rhizohabitans arisaemae]|uniref:DUF4276 family protein n=1 Tax=Rhizohabitans arisaemae TaxID=2720610 RepID=UPI0024B0CBA3|nr:DUF4276 family protein [Rhizohabitans arisaemae]